MITHEDGSVTLTETEWLYEGKTVNDWLDSEGTEVYERDTDFVQVCDLASLDPALVKSTFLKLMQLKSKVTT